MRHIIPLLRLPCFRSFWPHLLVAPQLAHARRVISGLISTCILFVNGCAGHSELPAAAPLPPVSAGSAADPAYPDFSAVDLDGHPVPLRSFRGKAVMLQFWATWCASCTDEIRNLDLLNRRYADRGLVFVGVAVDDSAAEVRAFRDRFRITMPLLIDADSSVKEKFHLMGLPLLQVLDRTGRIATVEDPKTHEFTERISGIRQWATPEGQASIERLLRQQK